MKRKIAAVLALSYLVMTACGRVPEQTGDQSLTTETELTETTVQITEETPQTDALSQTAETVTTTANRSDAAETGRTSTAAATTQADTRQSGVSTTARNAGGNAGGQGNAATAKPNASTGKNGAQTTKTSGSGSKSTSKTTAKTTAKTTTTTKATTTSATTPPPTEPPTEPPVQEGVTKIVNGVMVVNSGTDHPRAIELYSGNFNQGTRYAETLNGYKAALGDAVNVYCMVVPTSQAFYTPPEEAGKYGNQLDMFNHINGSFNGVTGVPVYETLDAHKEEQTYSRTDYHWQPLAAYYAAEQFAAFAGVPYAGLETYTPVVREGYVGAFYRVNQVSELGNHPEQFTYYKPANLDAVTCTYYNTAFGGAHQGSLFFENNSVAASYTVFVGTDECILEADTDVDNGRVLVIFKDSYGNALVPFLTQSFSKIYLCDFRYFDRNAISFIQEVGATDLLFAMSTVAVTTSSKVDKVANNLTK